MGDAPAFDPNSPRDRHLFGPGPKRILAFDGGGVRGVISVAFAQRIEQLLTDEAKKKEESAKQVRLCDAFDLIGGTSTGSIVATGLALGLTTGDMKRIYKEMAPRAFETGGYRIPFVQPKFDAGKLADEIAKIVGKRTLDDPKLETGLGVIAKRADTASVWLMSNSPRAPYWETDGERIGNRYYRLANLIRASTAAPTYFEPEWITIHEGKEAGLFIDGGMSPHNNPALAMFMLSQLEAYGMRWATGTDKMTIVSIGTGSYRKPLGSLGYTQFTITKHALLTMMDDAQGFCLALLQWMGKCLTPWEINSEWHALAHDQLGGNPLFRFLRYDVRLDAKWLKDHTGMTVTPEQLEALREIGRTDHIDLAYEIGCAAAESQVLAAHWQSGGDTVSATL